MKKDQGDPGFDWSAAEAELGDIAPPPRFTSAAKPVAADDAGEDPGGVPAHEAERPALTLGDVGGLAEVRERLQVAFLAPMRNPELRRIYGKSLRGGLLLYGPPGCGKTFIARAAAGEIGASFISVGISEVLELWFGASEKNLSELFELARRQSPCVLFFDELDALGQRRGQTRSSMTRTVVYQFLTELDSVGSDNEGVFVLGATNAPWDVDPALRRPGRFDRTVLVLPPDAPARKEILRYHLRERPIAGIDLQSLVKRTDGFSGADIAHLCESATENALIDAVRSGEVRLMGMPDFEAALKDVRSSTGPWSDAARSVALFVNEGGTYDDLAAYFKSHKGAKGPSTAPWPKPRRCWRRSWRWIRRTTRPRSWHEWSPTRRSRSTRRPSRWCSWRTHTTTSCETPSTQRRRPPPATLPPPLPHRHRRQ